MPSWRTTTPRLWWRTLRNSGSSWASRHGSSSGGPGAQHSVLPTPSTTLIGRESLLETRLTLPSSLSPSFFTECGPSFSGEYLCVDGQSSSSFTRTVPVTVSQHSHNSQPPTVNILLFLSFPRQVPALQRPHPGGGAERPDPRLLQAVDLS